MCVSLCVVQRRKREQKQPVGMEQQGIEFFMGFFYIYTCHASIVHTFLHYICSRTDLRKHANYIDKWANYRSFPPTVLTSSTQLPTHALRVPCFHQLYFHRTPPPSSATSFKKCCDLIPEMVSLARVTGLMIPSPTLMLLNMAVGILEFSAVMDILVTRLTLKISCVYLFIQRAHP